MRFHDFVGDVPASEITEAQCREYIAKRRASESRPSPATLRKEITFLARVLARAGNDCWRNIPRPREMIRPPVYLTPEQFASLLLVAPQERVVRYSLLVYTGARRGEALALRWRDIDLDQGTVRIRNAAKGRGHRHIYRVVPLCNPLRQLLESIHGGADDAVILPSANWGRHMRTDCRKAGIKGHWRPHDLRHTFCSWLAQAGISLQEIRDLAGHKSITTTERYAHLAPGVNIRIVHALNATDVSKTLANNEEKRSATGSQAS